MNDAAVRLRLAVFASKVQRFYIQITEQTGWGGERGEGCHLSDLLCWLTVIWSGAPTDSLEGGPQVYGFPTFRSGGDRRPRTYSKRPLTPGPLILPAEEVTTPPPPPNPSFP